MSKERPILFSAPMVRAILEGRKTQTRRVVKPQPTWDGKWFRWDGHAPNSKYGAYSANTLDGVSHFMPSSCPYGLAGDRLWVRETWAPEQYDLSRADPSAVESTVRRPAYKADWKGEASLRWRPSIHMPRTASRITLEITGVRVERLQEISERDAQAEGWPQGENFDPITWYSVLWRDINGADSWAANPWVWVVSFERKRP